MLVELLTADWIICTTFLVDSFGSGTVGFVDSSFFGAEYRDFETYANFVTFDLASTDFEILALLFALNAGGRMRDEGDSNVLEAIFQVKK